jgi:hypothetical protein
MSQTCQKATCSRRRLRSWEFPIVVQDFLARAIDALPEDLADKAHKQTICSTSIRVLMQDRAVASHVHLGDLVVGPFDGGLGRHALDRLGIQVGDDVFRHYLGGLAVGRPRVPG